jgi:hypothetical protein
MLPPITSTCGKVLLDPAHALDHALAVAVRGVDHHGIDTGSHQGGYPIVGIATHAHGRALDLATLVVQLAARRSCSCG